MDARADMGKPAIRCVYHHRQPSPLYSAAPPSLLSSPSCGFCLLAPTILLCIIRIIITLSPERTPIVTLSWMTAVPLQTTPSWLVNADIPTYYLYASDIQVAT